MGGLIETLKTFAESVILSLGYAGIGLLMFLDAANIPIPSEVIMPFGGILASEGKMNLHLVAWAGGIGSTLGSAFSYWLGAALGKPILLKYGKYIFLRPKEIETGERWFERYGLKVTLWGRFIPLVRTFISIPAGLFKAHFPTFLLYAFLGCLPWCYLWAFIGFKLGKNWETVEKNMKYLEIVVVLGLLFLIGRFLWYRFKKSPDVANSPEPSEANS